MYWTLAPMRRLLFLDYDGVLWPTRAPGDFTFGCVSRLAATLRSHECDIVVSSSWRFHRDWDDLLRPLGQELGSRVVGATGGPCYGRWPRYQEIQAYMRAHAPGADWRALDDSQHEFPPGCLELFVCNPNVGVDERPLQQLHAWLGAVAPEMGAAPYDTRHAPSLKG